VEDYKKILGEWNIGFFQSNGIIISPDRTEIGTFWIEDNFKTHIIINVNKGGIHYEAIFNPDALTLVGTYKNFNYKWKAQVTDPYAKSYDGIYSDTHK